MMKTEDMMKKPMETMSALGENMMQMGRTVWLAGLGMMATVETEGKKVMDRLVERGKDYQTKQPTTMVGKVVDTATGQVKTISDKIQAGMMDTSRAVLHRVGLPSHQEIQALIARVELLTQKVEALGRKEAR